MDEIKRAEFRTYLCSLKRTDHPETDPILLRARTDWEKNPALGKIFQGVDEYTVYLKKDFESLVSDEIAEKKCSRGEAIRAIAKAYPDIHRKWIEIINLK